MHKAIIFDLGKVLVDFDFARGYRALEGLCPYPAMEIPRRIATTDLVKRFETGLVEPHDFFEQFSQLLDLHLEYPRFCEIWSSVFTEMLMPENVLAGLARGYRLLLLSNTNAIHMDYIFEHYTFLNDFDAHVLSHEVGLLKPDAAIYRYTLEKYGLAAERTVFVDDLVTNVEGARRVGMQAIHFQDPDQACAELTKLGVSPI